MTQSLPMMPRPRFLQLTQEDEAAARAELAAGLARPQATISPKYLYDTLGSRLFEAITELPEYYPTRTERAVLEAHLPEIAAEAGTGSTLIDLGAGNCAKAASLFAQLRPERYVAVDISVDFMRQALEGLQRQHPGLPMAGVGIDFSTSLALPSDLLAGRPLFFYPGSSIGNFTPDEALQFLQQLRRQCGMRGRLLIGVDRVKPREVLEPAYADELGVTAAFNLNLLRHVNRRLGADFSASDWQHLALWNEAASRIEMHLQARRDVSVHWHGGARRFGATERIHTENSYKYRPKEFEALLRDAGFEHQRSWSDERGWFSVILARA